MDGCRTGAAATFGEVVIQIMNGLELENIYYRQGDFLLKDIRLALPEGTITALAGRSGAGKSTLIKLIGHVFEPGAGKILYLGKELYEDEKNIRGMLSVVYDTPNMNMELRAERLAKSIQKIEPWFSMEMFYQYMEKAKLNPRQKIRQYSQGMCKKYMLILALCRKPKILVLDEPTSNVDPVSVWEMRALIAQYRTLEEVTILYSTHNYGEMKRFADKVILLEDGAVRFTGAAEEFISRFTPELVC